MPDVYPFQRTHLSLAQWAKIIGVNPVHFQGAVGGSYWPDNGSCDSIWPRHSWQVTEEWVSREDVNQAILQAETEIQALLKFPVSPQWVVEEVNQFPRTVPIRSVASRGKDLRWFDKAIDTKWGKLISAGQRATTAIETGATVTYSDADGDGWSELATITAATTLTDTDQIKIYFAGTSADPRWEIRPVKSKSIAGGVVTITVDSWLLIDPDTQGAYPTTSGFSAIDISTTTNFVTTVDVYREYNDSTATSATFYWEPQSATVLLGNSCSTCGGSGCEACGYTTQDGCMIVRDSMNGLVAASPATESDGTWTRDSWTVCRDPQMVKIWYHAGEISEEFLKGYSYEPLDHRWAQAISWLATARLEKPICSCTNVQNVVSELRRDLTKSSRDFFYTRFESMDIFKSGFGTRVGEVRAWQLINSVLGEKRWKALVI